MPATVYEAIRGAHALVMLTEWNEFRAFDWTRVAQEMEGRIVIDLRNIYQPDQVAPAGLAYRSIVHAAARPQPVFAAPTGGTAT